MRYRSQNSTQLRMLYILKLELTNQRVKSWVNPRRKQKVFNNFGLFILDPDKKNPRCISFFLKNNNNSRAIISRQLSPPNHLQNWLLLASTSETDQNIFSWFETDCKLFVFLLERFCLETPFGWKYTSLEQNTSRLWPLAIFI